MRPRSSRQNAMGWRTSGSEAKTCILKPGGSVAFLVASAGDSPANETTSAGGALGAAVAITTNASQAASEKPSRRCMAAAGCEDIVRIEIWPKLEDRLVRIHEKFAAKTNPPNS